MNKHNHVKLDYLELQSTTLNLCAAPEKNTTATKGSNVFHFGILVYEMTNEMNAENIQNKPLISSSCKWKDIIDSCLNQEISNRPTMLQVFEALLATASAEGMCKYLD